MHLFLFFQIAKGFCLVIAAKSKIIIPLITILILVKKIGVISGLELNRFLPNNPEIPQNTQATAAKIDHFTFWFIKIPLSL